MIVVSILLSIDYFPKLFLWFEEFAYSLFLGVILESSGDLGSGDSLFNDDDEDSFVLNDQAGMDDEDDEDEDDDDVNDEYLS